MKLRNMSSVIVFCTLAMPGAGIAFDGTHSSGVVIRPDSIPIAESEIVNPDRGYFTWHGENIVPQPGTPCNTYNRYIWRALQSSKGVYDFTAIDKHLDSAKAHGRKHGIRIMSVNDYEWNTDYATVGVPLFIKEEGLGIGCPKKGRATDSIFVPSWNDPVFLGYLYEFIDTLGKRYDGDPRLAYVDIGFYGHWGEWHLNDLCGPRMTFETKRAVIDAMIAAFPGTRLLMVPDEGATGAQRGEALKYAMERDPRMGFRKDNLTDNLDGGGSWFVQEIEEYPLVKEAIEDRWRTTPFVAEFIGWSNDIELAEEQVKAYHVSSISNGNIFINKTRINKWSEVTTTDDQAALIAAGKAAGYRLLIDSMIVPDKILAGTEQMIIANWLNRGSAPIHEPWNVEWELRSMQGTILWKERSSIDLREVMPDSAHLCIDSISVPGTVPAQRAILQFRVIDSAGYFPPLRLAIKGRTSDGAYPVDSLHIDVATASDRKRPGTELAAPGLIRRGDRLMMSGVNRMSLIQLLRTDGRCIASGRVHAASAIENIPAGMYFLRIRSGDKSLVAPVPVTR